MRSDQYIDKKRLFNEEIKDLIGDQILLFILNTMNFYLKSHGNVLPYCAR